MTDYTEITVYESYNLPAYSDQKHPYNVVEFIAFLQEKLLLIPEELRDTAEWEIPYEGSDLTITYRKPKDEEQLRREQALREQDQAASLVRTEQHERALLAHLKAKYPDA